VRPERSSWPGWPAGHEPAGAAVFVHDERVVPADPQAVWDLLVDCRGWSSFYPNALRVRPADPDEPVLRQGSRFAWITFGMPITSTVECCLDPDPVAGSAVLGWSWTGPGAHGYHVWELTAHEHGTRIVTEETQRGPVPFALARLLEPVMVVGHGYWLRQIGRRLGRPRVR
jgi:hypothetical protein